MNRLLAIVCTVAMGMGTVGTAQAAKGSSNMMSFGFGQEFAGVSAPRDITIDLYKSTPASLTTATDIRIGAFGGEVMIDATGNSGIGYKGQISPKMAAYGMLYFSSTGSVTNLGGGIAYTTQTNDFILNGNAELTSIAGASTVDLRGAGFYSVSQKKVNGKIYLGAEIDIRLSPSPTTTDIYAGMRWLPKKNLIVDAGLITSTGGTTTIATPAFFRLNFAL